MKRSCRTGGNTIIAIYTTYNETLRIEGRHFYYSTIADPEFRPFPIVEFPPNTKEELKISVQRITNNIDPNLDNELPYTGVFSPICVDDTGKIYMLYSNITKESIDNILEEKIHAVLYTFNP